MYGVPSAACTACARAAGIASDPQKIARYRAAMRMRRALAGGTLQTPALKNFSRMLLKVRCEHACRAAWRLNPDVQDSFRALARASLPPALHELAGAPAEVWLEVASPPGDGRLLLDVVWVNKTATRLPEVRGPGRKLRMLSGCSGRAQAAGS